MESLINIGIILTYVMVAFAAFAAIGFGIKQMMQKTNNAKKTLYTIGGLFVIILDRAYLIKDGQILVEGTTQKISNDKNAIKYYLGGNFRL